MAKKSTTILYWTEEDSISGGTLHRHTYSLDSAGNGTTSFVQGHSHTIELYAMEEGSYLDHVHKLTNVVSSDIDTVPEASTDTSEAISLPDTEENIATVPFYTGPPSIKYNKSCDEPEIEIIDKMPFFKATQTVSYTENNLTSGTPTKIQFYEKVASDTGYEFSFGDLGKYTFENNNSEQYYFNIDIDNVELLTNKAKSNLDYSSFYLKALFDYNFLSKKYEEGINAVPDSTLPNQYGLILTTLANDSGIEISNWLNEIYNKLGFSVSPSKNEKTANDVFETYFERLSTLTPTQRSQLTNHMKNVIFPASSRDIMEEGMIEHYSFPMSTNIEFNTDSSTQFAQSLQNAKLGSALINYAQDGFSSDTTEINIIIKRETSLELDENSIQETTSPKRTISISEWWEKDWFGSSTESHINLEDQFFVGYKTEENASENDINNVTNKFAKIISWIAFAGGLKQIIKDRFISNMCDIFEAKKATYSEDVIYKISKFAGTSADGEELQNFWFSNSNEIDVIRFFDTQVKFNTDYTYKLTTYKMAIGTKYKSIELTDSGESVGPFKALMTYSLEPDVRLIEIDQLTFGGKIIDDPPVAPEVNFIPYRGVNNKVLLSLDSAVGEYNLIPITFDDSERDLINQIRIAQARPTGEIRFSSDEGTKSFEVYRMEEPPQNYNSFANKLLYTLSSQDYSSAEIIDNIEPNKKYYYTFRSVDYHNKISNPSAVFEYILIDADGAVYPELKIYDFNIKSPKVATKSMKKLFRVVPTFAQSAVNYDSTDFDSAPTLGTTGGESLFSSEDKPSRFKIRLTSKRSGKQIDFNVGFILKEKK